MRVGLLGKETLAREALACFLERQGRFDVVARESGARELLVAAKGQTAQVLVLDSRGVTADELHLVLGAKTFGDFRVVLVGEPEGLEGSDHAAVDRLLPRSVAPEELFAAITELGQDVKLPRIVRERRRGLGDDNLLTRREYEIARLVAQGMSNRRISGVSGLREQSVKNLVSVIMRKMGCENRVQVALKLVNAPREEFEPNGA